MAAETKKRRKKSQGSEESQGFLRGIRTYLSEVRTEMQKVTWPEQDEVISLTRVVIIVTIVSSLALGFLSIALTWFLDQIGLEFPIVLVVLFIAIFAGAIYMFRDNSQSGY